ncbi:MAG: polysaccharide biosynthesis protein [Clostridia bacterium]|nr:polysaccharide biosynthesis protein [Clostridia bacterium]
MNKRKLLLYLIDTAGFFGIYLFAALLFFVLPFETHFMDVDASFGQMALNALIVYLFIVASRIGCRIYTNIWRYASSPLYLKLIASDLLGSVAGIAVAQMVNTKIPLTFSAVVALTYLLFTLTNRMFYRRTMDANNIKGSRNKINVAIVGAGKVGVLLAKELTFNANSKYTPYCFIDSDTHKVGNYVSGIKVYPENDDTLKLLGKLPVQEIFIALPKLSSEEVEKVYNFYSQSNLKIKIYDLPVALLNDTHKEDKLSLREFKIEDLLFRDSIDVDTDFLKSNYTGKTILVTGGGGSIGSELCRQIARHAPKKLIILDIYENNAYAIEQYLRNEYGDTLDFCVEIASVRDVARLDCIFEHYKPDVVFHAAAHKHVPLMEHSSAEAVKNNVIGTYNTANMAEKHGVKKFILISTDKAVNPTNVMGASKRMCEMIVQCRTDSATSFVAVRFGNVLGSNGSVIPLFKTQIERGGPITLTDKRIIRYFMTIPEASQLVMYAGVIANRGELFVLDMGKPIKILDLAENMVRLSGLTPYKDIDIIEIGLRPGEKLYEELLIKTETLAKTANKKIFIEHDTPLSRAEVDEKIAILKAAAKEADKTFDSECIKEAMKKVVPSYKDPEKVNCSALQTDEMKMAGVK